jgi:putative ABC transport system permease protein
LLRVFLGPVEPLVVKNLARAPRRASNIAAIVTFAIAFLVAIGSITASAETYLNELIHRETPTDVVVEFDSFNRQLNLSSAEEVRAVPGVAEVTPILEAQSDLGTAFLFDATSYLRTVSWLEPRHLGGPDPRQLMEALAMGSSVAVNLEFQRRTGLIAGDPVSVSLLAGNGSVVSTFTGTLAAVVPSIPGIRIDTNNPQAYLDFSVLHPGLEDDVAIRWKYLVAVAPSAEASASAQILEDRFQDQASVWTLEERLRDELANPVRAGTFAYLTIQSQMAALLMVVGIGLLVFFAASARRNELVTLVARGLSRATVARLVMAEGWVVALLGILLGTAMGLLVTASVLAITATILPIPMPLIVPASVVLPLFVVVAGVLAASFLGALSIQRMDVARVLKLRGA